MIADIMQTKTKIAENPFKCKYVINCNYFKLKQLLFIPIVQNKMLAGELDWVSYLFVTIDHDGDDERPVNEFICIGLVVLVVVLVELFNSELEQQTWFIVGNKPPQQPFTHLKNRVFFNST